VVCVCGGGDIFSRSLARNMQLKSVPFSHISSIRFLIPLMFCLPVHLMNTQRKSLHLQRGLRTVGSRRRSLFHRHLESKRTQLTTMRSFLSSRVRRSTLRCVVCVVCVCAPLCLTTRSHERPGLPLLGARLSLIDPSFLLQCQRFFSPDCRRKSTPQAGCATKWRNELTPTIQYIQQPHDVFILSVRFLHPHRDVSFCFALHSLCIQRQRACSR
jgi:hypothetical protein